MAVEFRLLGDVAAWVDGRPVDVGHARQRCVLVALLVDANRPVPVDQLVDRVWADALPQRSRITLAGYLSRLRRTLDVPIVRRPAGYLLTVDPMAVDLHRFQRLVGQARTAGDAHTAAERYEEALRLWHGEPFATLDTPWLNAIRATLDAQRLAAQLDHNDLALAAGRHAELLEDLSDSALAYPLDERLAGQLMLALYRGGRQAEALWHFERVRRRLADEVGADPSPPLRDLHRQILTGDPALAAVPPPAATVPTGSAVPRQLPAPPRWFIGRAGELAALDAASDHRASDDQATMAVCVLAGTAGVGKTVLAVHWAHGAASRFPDGQLYVNLRGFDPQASAMPPSTALVAFLTALQVPAKRIPTTVDAQAGLYRSLLAGRRMMVVLDNARDADQVRPLLPGSPGCLVLVTSRNQMPGLMATDGAHLLTLDLFTVAEARDLLSYSLGADRVAAEPAQLDEIINRCARLPLALAVAAARAAAKPGFPLEAVAGELSEAADGLTALHGGDAQTDVRAVFFWSYRILGQAAARLFRLLASHPGPDLSTAAAASLAGIPPAEVVAPLAELAGAHLVTEPAPGRYACHDLLRSYAAELALTADTAADRQAAVHRTLDHYLHTAHAADRLVYPPREPLTLPPAAAGVTPELFADHDQAMAWFATERPVLLAAAERAAATGFETHAWQLAWAVMMFLNMAGHWHDQLAVQRVALDAARRAADRTGQAHAHRGVGRVHYLLGDDHDAEHHLRAALGLFESLADHGGQAQTHLNLARLYERQSHDRDQVHHDRRALDLLRRTGDRAGQARALNNLGWCHARRGEHRQALDCCRQALALEQQTGNRHGEANAWDSIGFIHHQVGRHDQAAHCFQRAVALFRQVHDRYYEADSLVHLGDVREASGDLDAARLAWSEALDIFDDLGHPDADVLRTKLKRAT